MCEMLMQGSEAGPLLQALMASLPKVPDMPKKAPAKLPVIQSVSASPQQQSQVHACHLSPPVCCLERVYRCCLDAALSELVVAVKLCIMQCLKSTVIEAASAYMEHA